MKTAKTCRRCSECKDSAHHWLPNADFGDDDAPEELQIVEYVCKHCDATGRACLTCYGDGYDENIDPCADCDGDGVIEIGAPR